MDNTIHVFERAGLGKAPFHIVGVQERRGPITILEKNGCAFQVGAPGQPMGTCKFCGQGIAVCWSIRSADDRVFEVGSDCVFKTGDAGMRKVINAHAREADAAARKRRALQKHVALSAIRTNHETTLQALPHPVISGKTLADYVDWMLAHSGDAGVARALKLVRSKIGGA